MEPDQDAHLKEHTLNSKRVYEGSFIRVQRDEVLKAHKDLANARSLTAREREIMQHVVTGEINKQIAFTLGLSEVTVKIHRGNVMRKMKVRSVAELIRRTDLIAEAQAA